MCELLVGIIGNISLWLFCVTELITVCFGMQRSATPIHNGLMPDTDSVQIVPLNMAEPVLFLKGERNATKRGFALHGVGRNMSRTMHKKLMAERTNEEIFNTETQGLDARFLVR